MTSIIHADAAERAKLSVRTDLCWTRMDINRLINNIWQIFFGPSGIRSSAVNVSDYSSPITPQLAFDSIDTSPFSVNDFQLYHLLDRGSILLWPGFFFWALGGSLCPKDSFQCVWVRLGDNRMYNRGFLCLWGEMGHGPASALWWIELQSNNDATLYGDWSVSFIDLSLPYADMDTIKGTSAYTNCKNVIHEPATEVSWLDPISQQESSQINWPNAISASYCQISILYVSSVGLWNSK